MKTNDRGFTLIEMMIVLLVISVLLIITIPNITKHNSTINTKGCKAFVNIIDFKRKLIGGKINAINIHKSK